VPRTIVLASTSRYRRELLSRLGLAFEVASPTTDETPLTEESPRALVSRLARAKADSVAGAMASKYPDALIIGSDQVAVLDEKILGKPGNQAANVRQLSDASGRRVTFLTGLCLLDTGSDQAQVDVVSFQVVFRELTPTQIAGYVARERPFDCAGGFKSESLGVALFSRMAIAFLPFLLTIISSGPIIIPPDSY